MICFFHSLNIFGKSNLTHLTTDVMFSGQRFAILAMFCWDNHQDETSHIYFFILKKCFIKEIESSNCIGLNEKTAFRNMLDLKKCPFTFMCFLVGFTASHSRFTREVWFESSDSLTSQSQLFQGFFFLLRTLQLIDWICLGANSSEMHNKVGRLRWGYHYNLFPAYTGWTRAEMQKPWRCDYQIVGN